ncbi:MAG TPA: methylmalonyl Co-A mutase-associated GTPase MeaB [Terriglobales bacterium]|nr:methylmalonyl Co-A mutase-associated GTPase MeaB [Terriglobales bacterium]
MSPRNDQRLGDQDGTLNVVPGVEQPPPVSMGQVERIRKARRRRLSAREYIDGILSGQRAVLAQAITLVESLRPDDSELALEILEACLPHTGESVRVGITGVPGVGKSTFIEALGSHLTRERHEKVAVLAIDPSSQKTKGSILGDKTRMEKLANDEDAFIRPSPSGGSLGGIARRTRETMLLCEAAGFRNVLIETVGVGQSETAVAGMVDFFLLLMLAGAGDELQGMKRGIMEMSDLIAINKADGSNRQKAQAARREYESALHLFPPSETGWSPKVVTCSAVKNEGIAGIWTTVLDHRRHMRERGLLEQRRQDQARQWMHEVIEQELQTKFLNDPAVKSTLETFERSVAEGRISSFRAAKVLLEVHQNGNKK